MVPRTLQPCIAIVGSTGVGKTALALAVAQAADAEIVNLDSRQVYRGLDIGSAKPTAAERALAPHHLFDVVAPDEPFDCARYRELACRVVTEIQSRGRPVVLVGGTGLYLRVLRNGLFAGPARNPALRAQLETTESTDPGHLYRCVQRVDPETANRVHPHDRVRLIRALEVYQLSGRPISEWQREHGFRDTGLRMCTIGIDLDRATLYARLNARCESMVAAGLIDEVRELWARGYGPELGPLRSIGYREIGAYLHGQCDLATAIVDMAGATRHLAKRQLTWFRADPDVRWYDAASVEVSRLLAAWHGE